MCFDKKKWLVLYVLYIVHYAVKLFFNILIVMIVRTRDVLYHRNEKKNIFYNKIHIGKEKARFAQNLDFQSPIS